jgi:hypothetical protein
MTLGIRFRSAVMGVAMGTVGAAGSYACGSNGSTPGSLGEPGFDSSVPSDGATGDDSSLGSDSTGAAFDATGETSTDSDARHDGPSTADAGPVEPVDAFLPDGFLETYDATADTSITTELDSGINFPEPDGPTLPPTD